MASASDRACGHPAFRLHFARGNDHLPGCQLGRRSTPALQHHCSTTHHHPHREGRARSIMWMASAARIFFSSSEACDLIQLPVCSAIRLAWPQIIDCCHPPGCSKIPGRVRGRRRITPLVCQPSLAWCLSTLSLLPACYFFLLHAFCCLLSAACFLLPVVWMLGAEVCCLVAGAGCPLPLVCCLQSVACCQ